MKLPTPIKRMTVADFLLDVDVRGADDCWEWKRARIVDGYGSTIYCGRKWRSHRLSFTLFVRPLKPSEIVCHRCDNPPCVNPSHLFAGSHKDNVADCIVKGRFHRECGEARYNARLTEDDIREIRRTYKKRVNGGVYALSKRFGVVPSMIHAILTGRRWKHVLPAECNPNEARELGLLV